VCKHRYYFAVRPAPINLDVMVAESMRDIPSDEELSGDENDPDLLVSFIKQQTILFTLMMVP
jgi:hypothetical protein